MEVLPLRRAAERHVAPAFVDEVGVVAVSQSMIVRLLLGFDPQELLVDRGDKSCSRGTATRLLVIGDSKTRDGDGAQP
jgi:hypothetical protein